MVGYTAWEPGIGHLLDLSTLWDGPCHHVLSSRDQFILRVGNKILSCHTIGGLKLVQMVGLQTKLLCVGFKRSFFLRLYGRASGKYRLLVLDGHGSHLISEFDETCSENDFIPICMPPQSSNYCQPLDVSCFSPLKSAYGHLAQNRMRQGSNHVDKLDFLEAYPEAREKAFSMDTIKSGFRATGLVPFNPEEVLGRLTIQFNTCWLERSVLRG